MCLGCLACCACQGAKACAEAGCTVCGKVIPVSCARVINVVLLLVTALSAWALGTFGRAVDLNRLPALRECSADPLSARSCYVSLVVARFMFALAVFHAIQALAMLGVRTTDDVRAGVHEGWWVPKVLVLAGGVVAALFIPNGFFVVWGWVSLVGSALFIFVQIVMLIDFACEWAHTWIENAEEEAGGDDVGCNKWCSLLMTCCIGMYVLALTLTILMYIFFCTAAVPGGCRQRGLNIFFITFNLFLAIVSSVMSMLPSVREKKPDSGLLQASAIALYTSYLVYSSVVSEPPEWIAGCNTVFTPATVSGSSSTGQRIAIIVGAIITVLAVCYSSIRNSGNGDKFGLSVPSSVAVWENKGDRDGAREESAELIEGSSPVPYSYTAFHLCFMLAAMYLEQLLTNWHTISKPRSGVTSSGHPIDIAVDSGVAAVWIKIVSSWCVTGLYIWSLIAPIIFPDRDFGSSV